jgi:hypothetical protein
MKCIVRKIENYCINDFFSPLRSIKDYAVLVLNATKLLLNENDEVRFKQQENYSYPYMKLVVKRMSRLFFYYNSSKYYTIGFPFHIEIITQSDEQFVLEISTKGILIDYATISQAFTVLNSMTSESVIDAMWGEDECIPETSYLLVENIMQHEPCYIRYDHDKKYEKELFHPLDHFDINFSSHGTYKLGLKHPIDTSYFENIVDVEMGCKFIEKMNNTTNKTPNTHN